MEHCISRICSAVFCAFTTSPTAECVTCPAVVTDYSIALLIKGRAARWPMSLLLWGALLVTAKHVYRRCRPISCAVSRQCYRLSAGSGAINHLPVSSDADIWLITGSPQPLVEAVISIRPGCRGLILSPAKFSVLWWLGIDDALSGT